MNENNDNWNDGKNKINDSFICFKRMVINLDKSIETNLFKK